VSLIEGGLELITPHLEGKSDRLSLVEEDRAARLSLDKIHHAAKPRERSDHHTRDDDEETEVRQFRTPTAEAASVQTEVSSPGGAHAKPKASQAFGEPSP
jgi:hypothetical protein